MVLGPVPRHKTVAASSLPDLYNPVQYNRLLCPGSNHILLLTTLAEYCVLPVSDIAHIARAVM